MPLYIDVQRRIRASQVPRELAKIVALGGDTRAFNILTASIFSYFPNIVGPQNRYVAAAATASLNAGMLPPKISLAHELSHLVQKNVLVSSLYRIEPRLACVPIIALWLTH